MYHIIYDIRLADYKLGMLDKVEIHSSVELLADTAVITLSASEYNNRLLIESEIKPGDKVSIALGYEETGLIQEFAGYLQRISTDKDSITLYCEDELYSFGKAVTNKVLKKVTLRKLLEELTNELDESYEVSCSYEWTYDKFVWQSATAYDVLKKYKRTAEQIYTS